MWNNWIDLGIVLVWLVVLTKTVTCSAIPTTLEDGTVKNCVEKLAFREELK